MTGPITEEPFSYESTTGTTPQAIPMHTKPRRMSTHAQEDAARAMRRTNSWTPVFERRQSWNKEDEKHAMHMASIDTVKTGPGFSER